MNEEGINHLIVDYNRRIRRAYKRGMLYGFMLGVATACCFGYYLYAG